MRKRIKSEVSMEGTSATGAEKTSRYKGRWASHRKAKRGETKGTRGLFDVGSHSGQGIRVAGNVTPALVCRERAGV